MNLKHFFLPCLSAALLSCGVWVSAAQAGAVTTQLGMDDGLGLTLASGDAFYFGDLNPGTGVDEWHEGGFSTVLSSSWSGTVVAASLEVFSGGWGLDAPAQVLLNGTVIGTLSVGDLTATPSGENVAFRDVFSLDPFLGLLNGNDLIEIQPANAGDDGALGLLKLTLRTQDAGGNTVAEPASLALAGLALVGVVATRRRRA
ncbi:MAG: PEP-CTERM sorting domain-containing protein [Burkholderiales bacterium]|jgi:hypothetical protein|nr:PEP-CTERM sorting domain-containing protein [Burkholderiales bacterium]